MRQRGNEEVVSSEAWLEQTLDEVLARVRELLDVTGCAFQVVDWERGQIRPAAAWFADDETREALDAVLTRPYDAERGGVTEAAIESGQPLLIGSVEEWAGAERLRRRLFEQLGPDAAERAWAWYRSSSYISCPVRTADGRMLGVLAISRAHPRPLLTAEDLRVVEVFADLAALGLERARQAREQELLNRAAREVGRLLEPEAVYRATVEQAVRLTGAPKSFLARYEPATEELRVVAARGFTGQVTRERFRLGEGMVGRVAATGEPYISDERDADDFLTEFVAREEVASFVHVPISLGPRLFGVLNVSSDLRGWFDAARLDLVVAFARAAAGAIANALDFQRERRVAHALTRGFIPGPAPALPGLQIGLVYEPAGHGVGGGDIFGAWTMPSGASAVLIGDVSGKGLEVAALSSMVRFFVEARTWDSESPAEVLAQTAALLRHRLPSASFVSAFMGVIDDGRLRYANAGHGSTLHLSAAGGEQALTATGLPLGVEDGVWEEKEVPFAVGDVLFAATDGLAEARREGAFFGAARLPALLAEHGRRLGPEALVALVRREVEAWAPELDDDVVILAVRRC
jgi:serine phosphatase RsbU (regulator of sigma subunit)